MKTKLLIVGIGSILLTACATNATNPYTEQSSMSNAAIGGLSGAAVGGAIGAAVGAYMDSEQKQNYNPYYRPYR